LFPVTAPYAVIVVIELTHKGEIGLFNPCATSIVGLNTFRLRIYMRALITLGIILTIGGCHMWTRIVFKDMTSFRRPQVSPLA
jgi:hypothetical protein